MIKYRILPNNTPQVKAFFLFPWECIAPPQPTREEAERRIIADIQWRKHTAILHILEL